MWTLKSRLSKHDADDLAFTIASVFTMGTAHPAFRKVRRLGELGPGEESDLFDQDDLKALASVLEPFDAQHYPDHVALRDEVAGILTTGR